MKFRTFLYIYLFPCFLLGHCFASDIEGDTELNSFNRRMIAYLLGGIVPSEELASAVLSTPLPQPDMENIKTAAEEVISLKKNSGREISVESVLETVSSETYDKIFNGNPISQAQEGLFYGISGKLSVDSAEKSIAIARVKNPVVFVFLTSNNNQFTSVARVRSVSDISFTVVLEIPEEYTDISSQNYVNLVQPETVHYLVFPQGGWKTPNGTYFEVGTFESDKAMIKSDDDRLERIDFNQSFSSKPVLLTTLQSARSNVAFLKTRQDVFESYFEAGIEPEEEKFVSGNFALNQTEKVGYFAIEEGKYSLGEITLYSFLTPDSVTHLPSEIAFPADTFGIPPNIITQMQSYDGTDPSKVRVVSINNNLIEVLIEECVTRDAEIVHITEIVGGIAYTGDQGIFRYILPSED